ncbi:MFS transporter [Streptomyces griseus]|uniref:MFS transporter n=1 Tax=Streptomyces griseus TaxID=1911 RepID=UPI00068A046A|nr:MFS transporter [Streptomyces griseus]
MSSVAHFPALRVPAGGRAPARSRRWALLVLLAAVFMTTLDFFIVNAVAPATRRDLGAGQAALQCVLVGYGLAYAIGLITAGRLGDLYGPRRVFAVGLGLFTGASALCGLAPSVEVLVGARIGQGVAAALMGPQVLALLGLLFPGADRARAFAWYGATVGVAGTGGQAVGGLLLAVDPGGLGWRACFLINVPLGVVAFALVRLLPADAGARRGAWGLDPVGAVLSAAGLVALVLPLVVGREAGWPGWAWASLGLSVPLLGGFAVHQRRRIAAGRSPLLDPVVFRDPGFTRGVVSVALLFGGSAGLTFVLSLYLQEGRGMSPVAAGVVGVALNASFFAASVQTGRLTGRLGGRLAVVGGVVLAAGFALIGWSASAVGAGRLPLGLVAGLAVTGAGMGLLMAPLTASAMAGVRSRLTGMAAGVLGTAQETAGVLGIALTGLVFFHRLSPGASAVPGEGAGAWLGAFRTAMALLAAAALVIALIAAAAHRRRVRAPEGTAPDPGAAAETGPGAGTGAAGGTGAGAGSGAREGARGGDDGPRREAASRTEAGSGAGPGAVRRGPGRGARRRVPRRRRYWRLRRALRAPRTGPRSRGRSRGYRA